MTMKRREFLATAGIGLGVGLGLADNALRQRRGSRGGGGGDQTEGAARGGRGALSNRTAKTTRMFKSPGMYPNALAVMTDAPGGLWIGQQKITAANSKTYNLPVPADP